MVKINMGQNKAAKVRAGAAQESIVRETVTRTQSSRKTHPNTLAVDIGGTGVKMMVLGPDGQPLTDRVRSLTPHPATPKAVLRQLDQMRAGLGDFDRIGAGFPGVIKEGKTMTAPNLSPQWIGFPLQATLERMWQKPARIANDCAVQGYASVQGKGVELVLTVGTGLGSAIFTDGHLCPGLELGHHPWRKKTYEDYLGIAGLKKYGKKHWNKLLLLAIEQTAATFNWDTLYIGGGNNKDITGRPGPNIKLIPNENGLLGAVPLWRDQK